MMENEVQDYQLLVIWRGTATFHTTLPGASLERVRKKFFKLAITTVRDIYETENPNHATKNRLAIFAKLVLSFIPSSFKPWLLSRKSARSPRNQPLYINSSFQM